MGLLSWLFGIGDDDGDRRPHRRIKYPSDGDRPIAVVSSVEMPLVDLSMSGARFIGKSGVRLAPGQSLDLMITFPEGYKHKSHAKVVRLTGHLVAVTLDQYVPKNILIDEYKRVKGR